MQLIESNRLLSTCKRCGLKFEVNSLITYPLYCPKCDFNKSEEEFNRSSTNGR